MDDRELDALVAEKVMGWSGIHWVQMGYLGKQPFGLSPEKEKKFSEGGEILVGNNEDVPNYSTDITAAMLVASKVCGPLERMHLHLVWRHGNYACATFKKHPVGYGGYQELSYCEDEDGNAARAICLAALKAVGVDAAALEAGTREGKP